MTRFRFTIASLLGFVVFAGVAFAALREATALWNSAVFTLTLFLLLASVLVAINRTGEARAFWVGFALFGGGYLVACLYPPVEARLATTRALAYLDSKVPDRQHVIISGVLNGTIAPSTTVAFSAAGNGFMAARSSQGQVRLWNAATGKVLSGPGGTSLDFVQIGHSLLALLAALAGGRFSRWLQASRRSHDETPADPAIREA